MPRFGLCKMSLMRRSGSAATELSLNKNEALTQSARIGASKSVQGCTSKPTTLPSSPRCSPHEHLACGQRCCADNKAPVQQQRIATLAESIFKALQAGNGFR